MTLSRSSAAFRIAAYYAVLFTGMGVHLPFWPVWLADRGLTPAQIGMALAAPYVSRSILMPVMGFWADHAGERRRPIVIGLGAATLAWCCFTFSHSFGAILVISMIGAGLWGAVMPVGDTLAIAAAHHWAFDFGRVRLWGSLAFILASTLTGQALGLISVHYVVWLIAAAMGVTSAVAALLPDLRVPHHERVKGGVRDLLAQPAFRWFLLAVGANQAGHLVYYGFATLHWSQAGLSSATIGMLWGEGVVAEILLFSVSGAVVRRLGPERLLLIAGLGGMVRWTVLASTTALPWLIATQVLHACTFGCAHLGIMFFLQRTIAPGLASRAQSINSAITSGAVPALLTPVAGWAYGAVSGAAFLAMTALAGTAAFAAAMLMCRSKTN